MPSTVASLMDAAELDSWDSVTWGEAPASASPGVYLVTIGAEADSTAAALPVPPIDVLKVEGWLQVRPELTMDGKRPAAAELAERLAGFWLPDEVILCIGKAATSLRRRVAGYYTTPLGARRPHAGGHFIKTLSILDSLTVHYAETSKPGSIETAMIAGFVSNVSTAVKSALLDPQRPFPFANLEHPAGTRKRHGLMGTRERR